MDSVHESAPPPFLQDDPDGADAARQKLAPKKGLARLLSKAAVKRKSSALSSSSRHPSSTEPEPEPEPEQNVQVADLDTPISLDGTALIGGEGNNRDQYQWAVIYENQRGLTVFSIPYYSSLSLLPIDPPPYTLPDTSSQDQHPVTPNTYPLPDGTWRWVSRSWMIDMRSESTQGQVQHDGFEYNWIFRKHHWKAQVGPLNAGGLVRRRRWVRLMVRTATNKHRNEDDTSQSTSTSPASYSATPVCAPLSPTSITELLLPRGNRTSQASSHPSSLISALTDFSTHSSIYANIHPDEVWTGTSADADWERCRRLMRRFGRDGRKLDLWRLWLGFYHPEHKERFVSTANDDVNEEEKTVDKGKQRQKQWTEDDEPLPSEVTAAEVILSKETVAIVAREHMIPVLRTHAADILHLFIFPDSRAQFLKLLGQAGLLLELDMSLDSGMAELDFWSYISGLADLPGSQVVLNFKSPIGKKVTVDKLTVEET